MSGRCCLGARACRLGIDVAYSSDLDERILKDYDARPVTARRLLR